MKITTQPSDLTPGQHIDIRAEFLQMWDPGPGCGPSETAKVIIGCATYLVPVSCIVPSKEAAQRHADAARSSFMRSVAQTLRGSYNDRGISRWFARNRTELGDRSPSEILQGDFDPESDDAQAVLRLAQDIE